MCFGCKTSSILNKGRVFQFAKTRSKWIVSVYVPWLIKKVKRTPIPTFQQMYRLFMGRPICLSETLKRKRKRKWILVKEITCYKHLQNKTLNENLWQDKLCSLFTLVHTLKVRNLNIWVNSVLGGPVHSAVPVEGFMSKLILNLVIVPRTKFYIYSIVLLFIFQTKWNYPRTSAL